MAYEARLEIGVDSRDAKRDVDGLDSSLGRVEKSGNRADKATRRFGKGARSTANDLNKLRTVAIGFVGAIGGAAALRAITRSADTYTNLRSQLRLVTESQEELNEVYQQTFQLAQTTRQDFEGTVNLYARLARSTDELGLSNENLLTITKAINQSFIISGATAEEAAGAVRQLSQGMASGTLRGEELNSVMENSPRLARAIADQMGITIGQLREMGKDGKITAETISSALIGASSDIEREFRTMERTVGQAMQQLRNDVLNALGPTETAPLVDAIDELRDLVSDPAFRENLISLTSAAIGGFKSLSEVIANTGKELQMLGVTEGPAPDSFAQLKEVQRQIKELEEEASKSVINRDLLLSPMGPGLWTEGEIQNRIRQLKAEAAVLRENLLVERPGSGGESAPASGPSFTPRNSGPTKEELKEQEDALQRVIDAASARTQAFREAAVADKEVEQARMDALEDVRASLRTEEEAINASYQRRMQMVLENTVAGSDQRTQLEMKLAQDRVNQLNAIEDQRLEHQQQLGQQLLTFTSQQLSITTNMLATAGKKNSDLYKTLIAIQRAAAIPSMIISTEQAATAALAYGGPAGPALAAAVRGLGYASVGIAAAQTFAGSFEGGGFTGMGPRSGGIDGKGGFPAIMHPNETVIDHTKKNSGPQLGGNVTVNMVEDASKAGQVQQRQNDEGTLITAFVSNIRNDGAAARAIQQTYGVKRVGT